MKNILTIDIGNTNSKFTLWDSNTRKKIKFSVILTSNLN